MRSLLTFPGQTGLTPASTLPLQLSTSEEVELRRAAAAAGDDDQSKKSSESASERDVSEGEDNLGELIY